MLSDTSRLLTYICAILYALTGALLFLFPAALAPVFTWQVTPFMLMAIGGWCLGNAWLAFLNARRWGLTRTSLLYFSLWRTDFCKRSNSKICDDRCNPWLAA